MDFDTFLIKIARMPPAERAFVSLSRDTPPVRLTIADVEHAVSRTASWLADQGCGEGVRVAALTLNSIETVILEWATYLLKAIWVGIPSRMREPSNIKEIVAATKPGLLFIQPAALEDTYGYLADLASWPGFRQIDPADVAPLRHDDGLHFSRFSIMRTDAPRQLPNLPEDRKIVRFRYTSGAGGESKGIVYTANTRRAIHEIINDHIIHNSPEVMIHALPIFWATGSLIAPVFMGGGCNVLIEKWDVRTFVDAVLHEECTLTFLVPSILSALVTYSERNGAGWARSLKRVILAGAPTPIRTMRRARDAFPDHVRFCITLGTTEASFPITWHEVSDDDLRQEGRALMSLGRLTDPYRRSEVIADELHVKGNAVALGEWERKTPGGYRLREFNCSFQSGDLVEANVVGILHYLGRKNVPWAAREVRHAPEAIEALLNDCCGVRRSRVDRMERADRIYVSCGSFSTSGPFLWARVGGLVL